MVNSDESFYVVVNQEEVEVLEEVNAVLLYSLYSMGKKTDVAHLLTKASHVLDLCQVRAFTL